MNNHSRTLSRLLLLLSSAALLAGGCGHDAASTSPTTAQQPSAETTLTIAETALSDERSANLEDEAKEALTSFRGAKEAVARRDAEASNRALEEAHTALHELAKDRPSILLSEQVWSAQQDEPLLERDFDFAVVDVPVTLPEEHLDLLIRDRPAFRGAPAAGQDETAPQRVAEDMLIYSEVDLPVVSTMRAVDIARKAVTEGRWEDAEEALNRAEQAMDFVTTFSAGPLSQLRTHTWRAMAATSAGAFDQARAELQNAQKIASSVEADEGQTELVRTEAGRIQVELDTLHTALDQPSGADFGLALDHIGALVQRWVALTAVDLEDVALRDALAEAIWQLDIAELWIRDGDPKDATEPGALAEAALDQARKADAGPTTLPVLEQLLAKLVAVNKLPPAERLGGYADLQGGLRDLLYKLSPPAS